MNTKDRSRQEATAYHEAGHAVAHHRLFPQTQLRGDLTIIPNQDENMAGSHTQKEHWGDTPASYQDQVLYLCSGYAACVAVGIDAAIAREGCGSDFDKAKEIIVGWRLAPFDEQLGKAVELMQRPENRRAVQRLADELMEHLLLLPEEIDVLIDVADGAISEEELARFRSNGKLEQTRKHAVEALVSRSTGSRGA